VVEVKTTDAYRISLDRTADYREKLILSDYTDKTSSMLIVVGRDDTGELEAQVRGHDMHGTYVSSALTLS
jgi:hypothetical protein